MRPEAAKFPCSWLPGDLDSRLYSLRPYSPTTSCSISVSLTTMFKAIVPQRVTSQPSPLSSMDLYNEQLYHDEKHPHLLAYIQGHRRTSCTFQDCAECAGASSQYHNTCHKSRLRRLLIPAILSLLTIAAIIFLSCLNDMTALGGFDGMLGMGKRDTSGTNNGNSTLVDNKLYLIIIFAGLLFVIILAIMLSAWCCRESFENPLCCPCYLCACCGGLACLECICCGLFAEGMENA